MSTEIILFTCVNVQRIYVTKHILVRLIEEFRKEYVIIIIEIMYITHVYKHSINNNHKHVWVDDFEILSSNCTASYKRKLSESLYIKEYNASLNSQEKSVKLNILN